jgi:hypothetical protein
VEEGICTAGFLDFPKTFSKPFGSSATLVPVNIVTATASRNLGRKVKPGKVFFIFFQYHYCKTIMPLVVFVGMKKILLLLS